MNPLPPVIRIFEIFIHLDAAYGFGGTTKPYAECHPEICWVIASFC